MPLLAYFLCAVNGVLTTVSLAKRPEDIFTGMGIFVTVLALFSYGTFFFLSYRLTIILMNDDEVWVLKPFRFKYVKFRMNEIKDLTWNFWGVPRFGDYRQLAITTTSGVQTKITDFEFINYDRLERRLMENTTLKLNLRRKREVEINSARANRWLNVAAIAMCVYGIIDFARSPMYRPALFVLQIILSLVAVLLIFRLVQYQSLINSKSSKKSK